MHRHPTPTGTARADARPTIPTQTARQAPVGARLGSAGLAEPSARLARVRSAV